MAILVEAVTSSPWAQAESWASGGGLTPRHRSRERRKRDPMSSTVARWPMAGGAQAPCTSVGLSIGLGWETPFSPGFPIGIALFSPGSGKQD
jgi:hypothetical protein